MLRTHLPEANEIEVDCIRVVVLEGRIGFPLLELRFNLALVFLLPSLLRVFIRLKK